MSDRIKRVELEAQLETLNRQLGTSFTLSHGPNGYAVVTGRQEKRRPAKEMYWTLDFAIDMVERLRRDIGPMADRIERYEEYIALNEAGFEEPDRALLREDYSRIEDRVQSLHDEHEADIDEIEAEGGDA